MLVVAVVLLCITGEENDFNPFALNILCRHLKVESLYPRTTRVHQQVIFWTEMNSCSRMSLGCRNFSKLCVTWAGPPNTHTSPDAVTFSSGRTIWHSWIVSIVSWPRMQKFKCADWINLEMVSLLSLSCVLRCWSLTAVWQITLVVQNFCLFVFLV